MLNFFSNFSLTFASCWTDSSAFLKRLSTMYIPYVAGSATCCAIKQPNPDRLVVTEGMPITVHSAVCVSVRVCVREKESV